MRMAFKPLPVFLRDGGSMVTSNEPVGIGMIGAGYISSISLQTCLAMFDNLRVVGISALEMARARSQAEAHGVEAFTVDDLIVHADVEIIVNLTIPAAHGDVALAAVEAGKSVYNEKPLTTSREQGQRLLHRAGETGVLVGGAPDTFLGGGLQTVRRLLDEGEIGTPVAASGMMLSSGHEGWHPNPHFYYQPGGGPLFDMGPYYLTALMSLLGPVMRVSGVTTASVSTRTIGSGARRGEVIPVETPTHIITSLEFACGPTASLTTSFDVWETTHSSLVIYGTGGTLRLPDPNTFGGPVELLRAGSAAWESVEIVAGHTENCRGIGVSDLARAIRSGEPLRASGEMAYHVVDIMHAALESGEQGRRIAIDSTFDLPDPLLRLP
ncbi:Gfo/Idh/MocA family oxidoreductase [soil metagenome]